MKRAVIFIFLAGILYSCGPKPRHNTRRDTRKKKEYYNMHELDQKKRDKVLINNMKNK